MGRFIHFALAATQEAMTHSGLKIGPDNAERVGVHIGSGIGGFDVIEREHTAMLKGGPRKISPFFIPGTIVNLAAGQVSIRYGALGPNEATSTACTTSAHSVGNAYRTIERDDADVMIAGGAEAAITPMGVGGFAAMRALSTRNEDPEHACRPFRQRSRRLCGGRRCRHPGTGRTGTRPRARREDPGRDHRLRHERPMPSTSPAWPQKAKAAYGPCAMPCVAPTSTPQRWTT